MAWTPQSNYAAVNATLKADPRYAAALQRYQQTLRANPTPTIAQQRQDDTGQIATQAADAVQKAKQDFALAANQILRDHGITDQERLGFNPDAGAVAYEPPDHSTRNILIGLGAIATAGVLTGALGGGAAVGGATLPTATGVGGLSATSTGLPITAGLGTAGTVGTVGAGAGAVGAGAGAAGAGAGGAGSVIPPATYGAGNVVTNFANVPPDVAGRTYADLLRYGLPTAGGVVDSIIKANAEGKASDAQQKYLQQALDYQKESDLYKRGVDAAAVAKEAARYGDYQGRIGPFIENGINSNDRMSALLGLPARTGGGGGGSGGGPPASQRVPTDPATQQAIRDELRRVNSSDDAGAWDEYLASHGDSAVKNWDYWKNRIDTGEGVGKGYTGPAAAPPAAAAPASVQMRAPDGSVKTIPADQVDFYRQRGATPLQGAA